MSAIQGYSVLGLPVSVTNLDHSRDLISSWAKDKKGRFVCVRDVASLMRSVDAPELLALHSDADLVLPDGMPIVWIGKARGLPVDRTCGPDLFHEVCRVSAERGLKHYFYGGKEGVADALARRCRERYPGIRIVGTECPPFRSPTVEEDDATVRRIIASGADIVWVGMSSPKQDVWMHSHVKRLPQTLIGVGAAFDFHSGAVKRAPEWMRPLGLESVYRLMSEPRRLWRRYLVLAPRFVWRVLTGWTPEATNV